MWCVFLHFIILFLFFPWWSWKFITHNKHIFKLIAMDDLRPRSETNIFAKVHEISARGFDHLFCQFVSVAMSEFPSDFHPQNYLDFMAATFPMDIIRIDFTSIDCITCTQSVIKINKTLPLFFPPNFLIILHYHDGNFFSFSKFSWYSQK